METLRKIRDIKELVVCATDQSQVRNRLNVHQVFSHGAMANQQKVCTCACLNVDVMIGTFLFVPDSISHLVMLGEPYMKNCQCECGKSSPTLSSTMLILEMV